MQKVSAIINRTLTTYSHEVEQKIRHASWEVGGEVARELRSTSPKRTGKYARSWTVDRHKRNGIVVRNASHYRLTHLLEYGHDIKHGNRVVGYSKERPHIGIAERKAIKRFTEMVEKAVSEG